MLTRFFTKPAASSCRKPVGRLLLLLALVAVGIPLVACETPVYRYAMYRWAPAPFEVYFFHTGALSESDKELHAELLSIAQDDESPLNCSLILVDLEKDPGLSGVLPDIRASWEAHKDQLQPGYLVTNPQGAVIHAGSLDNRELQRMASSPARTELSKRLREGHAIVFILLKGNEAAANRESAAMLKQLCQDVEDGKVDLYSVPVDPAAREDVASQQSPGSEVPTKSDHTVTFIEVDRGDEAEKFLVNSLLVVESDLEEITHPMVFPVYGRARALVPYIGKGIHRDNLLDCLEFVTGACSCTVKEQNPGIDLLVRFDWETAAAHLADRFGSEEGNEPQFGGEDFFPELIIGPVSSSDPAVSELEELDLPDGGLPEENMVVQTDTVSDSGVDDATPATMATGMATIGLLIGVFLLVLLLLSVFVLRPR
jgi:hypothetical protein